MRRSVHVPDDLDKRVTACDGYRGNYSQIVQRALDEYLPTLPEQTGDN